MDHPTTMRFCAQAGGVDVQIGEAEIVVNFPAANAYADSLAETDVRVELDAPTARHLAALLMAAAPSEAAEVANAVEAEEITLSRTGDAPLSFRGHRIASSDGERLGGKERNRWHEITVYRTTRGRYVVHVAYRTRWQGELDRDTAAACNAPSEVVAMLRDYNPLTQLMGFPPGEAYAERQERLEADVAAGYQSIVGDVLAKIDAAEVIE